LELANGVMNIYNVGNYDFQEVSINSRVSWSCDRLPGLNSLTKIPILIVIILQQSRLW